MAHDTPTRWSAAVMKPLSENTTVRLGLVFGIGAVLVGAIWWAATINAKLDSVIGYMQDHETRLRVLEQRRP